MEIEQEFVRHFDAPAHVVATAPGRINLIGEHVDYLDGLVLPAAIDRRVFAAARRIPTPVLRIWSDHAGGSPTELALDNLEPQSGARSWLNYFVGVIAKYAASGAPVPGLEIAVASQIPSGAGLSSSAAVETATALLVEALAGLSATVTGRALLCQAAEHDFAGVPCGIMDQLAVGAARADHALLIDCRDLSLDHIPLPPDIAIVVADTGVKHALGDGAYRERRSDCEQAARILEVDSLRDATPDLLAAARSHLGDRLFRRTRHAVTEMQRVRDFAAALSHRNFQTAGDLMFAGHDSLRDDFEVSCPELDALVGAARALGSDRGVIGSRMTGAGFGGATVSLVRRAAAAGLIDHLQAAFRQRFHRSPSIFTTRAVDGAAILCQPEPERPQP